MAILPDFTPEGTLPPGDYPLTLDQLRESMLVLGPSWPSEDATWDGTWRLQLVKNLSVLVGQLWAVGVDEIFIDGSFVEDKHHPSASCRCGTLIARSFTRIMPA